MRVFLLDNDDSFTWNLAQQVMSLGAQCRVVHCRDFRPAMLASDRVDRIILSPGPGHPKDATAALSILKRYRDLPPTEAHRLPPVLGVCLGHQCMGVAWASATNIRRARTPMHGKTSMITHDGTGIFHGLPHPMCIARYHSLVVREAPEGFVVAAVTDDRERTLMAMRHTTLPLTGVQFHPESFLTVQGSTLLRNFLSMQSR